MPDRRSAMAVPLATGEGLMGALLLFHPEPDYFTEDHLKLVSAAGAQIANAINNAELYRLITDQAERLGMMLRTQATEAAKHEAILKDIADRTGLDISTISRVVNSKYIQTHFGIYPLKYFFSEGMTTDSGEEVSTREIKKILQDCIDNEDKRKPLTDDRLSAILNEKGYQIARRTVAKYREHIYERLESTRLFKVLKASKLYKYYTLLRPEVD